MTSDLSTKLAVCNSSLLSSEASLACSHLFQAREFAHLNLSRRQSKLSQTVRTMVAYSNVRRSQCAKKKIIALEAVTKPPATILMKKNLSKGRDTGETKVFLIFSKNVWSDIGNKLARTWCSPINLTCATHRWSQNSRLTSTTQ